MPCVIEFPVLPVNVVRFPRRGVYAERETPVPGTDVVLPDGTEGAYLCETLSGRHFIVRDGVTVSVPSDWIGGGPDAA
jgi:hypothetical protein